jgi:phage terminase Nu1 subunit (DNA packaging protein)
MRRTFAWLGYARCLSQIVRQPIGQTMPLVGPQDLARLFGDDVSWIHRLTKEGMPQAARGRYELGACLLWYVKFLKTKLKERRYSLDEELATTERAERLRLVQAEAGLKELELARERGEFAAVADFEKMVTEMIVTTKVRVLALPARISAQLVGEDPVAIRNCLEKELTESLSTLTANGFKRVRGADGKENQNGDSRSTTKGPRSVAAAREIRV